MNKGLRILLILVAIACIGAALYYPINYQREIQNSENTLEQLIALRDAGRAGMEQAEESPEVTPGAMPPEFSEGDADAANGDAAEASETQVSEQNGGNAPAQSGEVTETEARTGEVDAVEPETPAAENDDANPAAIAGTTSGAAVALPGGTQSPDGEASSDAEAVEATPAPSPSPSPEPTVNRWERTGPLSYPEKERSRWTWIAFCRNTGKSTR